MKSALVKLKHAEQGFIRFAASTFNGSQWRKAQYRATTTEYRRVGTLACHAPAHTDDVTQTFCHEEICT